MSRIALRACPAHCIASSCGWLIPHLARRRQFVFGGGFGGALHSLFVVLRFQFVARLVHRFGRLRGRTHAAIRGEHLFQARPRAQPAGLVVCSRVRVFGLFADGFGSVAVAGAAADPPGHAPAAAARNGTPVPGESWPQSTSFIVARVPAV